MERKQFTFYRSFWEAIRALPKQSGDALFRALCEYALNGTEPELTGAAAGAFILIRPTLDRAKRQSEAAVRTNELKAARDSEPKSVYFPGGLSQGGGYRSHY